MKILIKLVVLLVLGVSVATNAVRPQTAAAQADPQTVWQILQQWPGAFYEYVPGAPVSILYVYTSGLSGGASILLQKIYIGPHIGNWMQLMAWMGKVPPPGFAGGAAGAGTIASFCGTMTPPVCFSLYGILIAETTYLIYNLGAWYNACGEYTKAIQENQKLTLKAATWECLRQIKTTYARLPMPPNVDAIYNQCINDYMERERLRVASWGNCRSGYGDAFCRMYMGSWGWNCDKAAPTPTPTPTPTRTPTRTPPSQPTVAPTPVSTYPTPKPLPTKPPPIPTQNPPPPMPTQDPEFTSEPDY